MGILLPKNGFAPTREKVWSVKKTTRPSPASEVRVLRRKGENFLQGKAQEGAFSTLKEDRVGASMLAYFDRGSIHRIHSGRQPIGVWRSFGSEGKRGRPCSILC